MMRKRLRLKFRTRLGLIITAVFITAGAGLLAMEYVVVTQLFATAIQTTTVSCGGNRFETTTTVANAPTGCSVDKSDLEPQPGAQGGEQSLNSEPDSASGAVIQQSVYLSNEVSRGLLFWSIVMLVVFGLLAAAIAFWLARRSMDRLGEVTSAASEISQRDLGRRLDLQGPDDEIKELGDTFDRMLDRLQLAFSAQDRFVANASHELRTPLTTTRTALEIPLEQGEVPPHLQSAVKTALRATMQSEALIGSLLALALGRARLDNSEPVDLDLIAVTELDEVSDAAAAHHVRIESDIAPASTRGDAALLGRAVRNLLENGIRHNAARGGRLWLGVREADGMAIVEVENTGAPIADEVVALLTEPFYRGELSRTKAGKRDGTGLGLAIVQSIVESHGGQLELVGRDGGGLIATLSFPTA